MTFCLFDLTWTFWCDHFIMIWGEAHSLLPPYAMIIGMWRWALNDEWFCIFLDCAQCSWLAPPPDSCIFWYITCKNSWTICDFHKLTPLKYFDWRIIVNMGSERTCWPFIFYFFPIFLLLYSSIIYPVVWIQCLVFGRGYLTE